MIAVYVLTDSRRMYVHLSFWNLSSDWSDGGACLGSLRTVSELEGQGHAECADTESGVWGYG